jgi:hypothetical protein
MKSWRGVAFLSLTIFFAYRLFLFITVTLGLASWLGWHWAFTWPFAFILIWIPILGSVFAMLSLVDVWGFSTLGAFSLVLALFVFTWIMTFVGIAAGMGVFLQRISGRFPWVGGFSQFSQFSYFSERKSFYRSDDGDVIDVEAVQKNQSVIPEDQR